MYHDNNPIKPGFVFFKTDLCSAAFIKSYPQKFQVARRGGYGYFCKINPDEVVNGCQVVTSEDYKQA